jgi:hypothetical protein
MTSETGPLTGGCACGLVRFEAGDLLWASFCHCRRCQQRTGAQASVQARVEPGTVRVTAGEDHLRAWVPEGGLQKVFCGTCGSALFGSTAEGEIIRVRLGAFDEDPGIRPVVHQFVAYAAPWADIPDDGLPRFDEQPPAGGPPF